MKSLGTDAVVKGRRCAARLLVCSTVMVDDIYYFSGCNGWNCLEVEMSLYLYEMQKREKEIASNE